MLIRSEIARNLAMQLCNAVAYLQDGIRDASSTHSSNRQPDPEWVGIVHRDIKPANIFFSRDDGAPYPRAMLGDFGQVRSRSSFLGVALRARALGTLLYHQAAGYAQSFRSQEGLLISIVP